MSMSNMRMMGGFRSGLLSALALSAWSGTAHSQVARVAVVQRVTEKKAAQSEAWQTVRRGEPLAIGDSFRTGKRSKADIRFSDGSLLRLGQLSSVEMRSAKGVRLTGGQLLFSALRPGRVLAGAAAGEIKGSVGIITLREDGSSEFTLYSGAMDVVTNRSRVVLPPGNSVTAFNDGGLSALRLATPLNFAGGQMNPDLLSDPSDAPYVGSEANLADRLSPERVTDNESISFLRGAQAGVEFVPFAASPPVVVPPTTPPPVTPPPTVPPPVTPPPVTPPPTVPPVTPPPVIQPPELPKLPERPKPPKDRDDDDDDDDEEDDRLNYNRFAEDEPRSILLASHSEDPFDILRIAYGIEGASSADAVAQDVTSSLDITAALAHLEAASRGAGRSSGADYRFIGGVGNNGTRISGGRFQVFSAQGKLFLDVALQSLGVRADGPNGRQRTRFNALSSANLMYRDRRGEIQIGRQRFLGGPTQATLFGSLVRQGARETMDAVRFAPSIGKNRKLELAYLYDAFPRDLPYRAPGRQPGYYARFAVQKPLGNIGLNLLRYQRAPVSNSTGISLDFAVPLVRNKLELYGEVGRDTFRRRLTTFGLAFPGLYDRTGFDLFLEYARLSGSSVADGPPAELALRAYRKISENVNLLLSLSRFSDGDLNFILGFSLGGRNTLQEDVNALR